MGSVSSFPVLLEYLLCLLWTKSSRVILMSCSKHFCIVNHRFLSPSPNQCKDIYAEHIKALDTIEKPITPCKTFAFGRWHHGIIHYTLHMPATYRKAVWPCLPGVCISATWWSNTAGAWSRENRPSLGEHLTCKPWKLREIMKAEAALMSVPLLCFYQTLLAVRHKMLARWISLLTDAVMLLSTSPGVDWKTLLSLCVCQRFKDEPWHPSSASVPGWSFCLFPLLYYSNNYI